MNGLKESVNAVTTKEAFKIRFSRVKNYVLDNALVFWVIMFGNL